MFNTFPHYFPPKLEVLRRSPANGVRQFPPFVTRQKFEFCTVAQLLLLLLRAEKAEELGDEDEATLSSLAWRLNHLGQTAVFARLIN